jgi:hypothetical protein
MTACEHSLWKRTATLLDSSWGHFSQWTHLGITASGYRPKATT